MARGFLNLRRYLGRSGALCFPACCTNDALHHSSTKFVLEWCRVTFVQHAGPYDLASTYYNNAKFTMTLSATRHAMQVYSNATSSKNY